MRYLLRRLGFFVLTLWAALTLNFFIPRMMPGSPLQALRDRTPQQAVAGGAEQPARRSSASTRTRTSRSQYVSYLKNMATGHWGISIGGSLGVPVTKLIGQALPWTLGLVGVTTVLAFVLGTGDRHRRRLAARRAARRHRCRRSS